jgi:hypothetical protein
MVKAKSNLSGKYFGTMIKKDINSKREGFQGMREFCSIWRNSMNKPHWGVLVYDAFGVIQ